MGGGGVPSVSSVQLKSSHPPLLPLTTVLLPTVTTVTTVTVSHRYGYATVTFHRYFSVHRYSPLRLNHRYRYSTVTVTPPLLSTVTHRYAVTHRYQGTYRYRYATVTFHRYLSVHRYSPLRSNRRYRYSTVTVTPPLLLSAQGRCYT